MTTKKTTIAKFNIDLHALDTLPKDAENVEDAYEKAGRLALARLLKRLADQLVYQDEVDLFTKDHVMEFSIEEENLDARFAIELTRIE